MTKFILHGGGVNVPSEDNKRFFAAIASGLKENDIVLLIYFSRNENDWPKFLEADKQNFVANGKRLGLVVADPDPEKLRAQIQKSKAIYVRGGDTFKLLEKIKLLPEFSELIKGKIYAGSSAGTYIVCKYFYENDHDRGGEGLGILPYQALAHWSEDKADKLEKLIMIGGDLPVLKLREGEHTVIEQ